MTYPLYICSWCMPRGIPGTHGICPKCYDRVIVPYLKAKA